MIPEDREKIKVLLVGCGAIGGEVGQALFKDPLNTSFELIGLCDVISVRAEELARQLKIEVPISTDYRKLFYRADLVIEAASCELAGSLAEEVLSIGCDVLILSVGGLLGKQKKLLHVAQSNKAHLYLPSGALAGMDAVRAMGHDGLKRVTLVTRKPPGGFKGTPYLEKQGIVIEDIKEEKHLFSGTVDEAVRYFPKNLNVAALLEWGVEERVSVTVELYASPQLKKNTHELFLEGNAGTMRLKVENTPSKANPKTSQLAILSVIATLNRMGGYIGVGS